MIKIEFSEADKSALHDERYNHPHPFVQKKMEVVWLKSQGVKHKDICRIAKLCSALAERQRRYQPVQTMAGAVQWRCQQILAQLSRLAKAAGDRKNPFCCSVLLKPILNSDRAIAYV